MAVAYDDALETLMTMFPEMDRGVVAKTLEQCGYHLERTVEALLSVNTIFQLGMEPSGIPEPAKSEFETNEERGDLLLALQLQREEERNAARMREVEADESRRKNGPNNREKTVPYDYSSVDYSDNEDDNQSQQEDFINLDEIADKITEIGAEIGEAAKQKFQFLASKFQGLIGDKPAAAAQSAEYKAVGGIADSDDVISIDDSTVRSISIDSDSDDEPSLIDRRLQRRKNASAPSEKPAVAATAASAEPKKEK